MVNWKLGGRSKGDYVKRSKSQKVIVHFELLVTTTYIIVYQHFKNIIYFQILIIFKIYYFCDVL